MWCEDYSEQPAIFIKGKGAVIVKIQQKSKSIKVKKEKCTNTFQLFFTIYFEKQYV